MFVGIELENIGPYTQKVNLDFRINKKDKTNLDSVCVLPDGEMVTKIAGIIAGNAYGKTTILNSLNAIGGFINMPFFKKNVSEYVNDIVEDEDLKKIILDSGKIRLLPANRRENNIACISVDMYIDSANEYSGYYTYTIKYDNDYLETGILEEKLVYRKTFNSRKKKEIFCVKNTEESEIGYKLLYRNNIENELPLKARKIFNEKLKYYDTFYKQYLDYSSTLGAENYIFSEQYIIAMLSNKKDFLKPIINLIDNEIRDIEIDNSDENNKKLYFIYDNYKLGYDSVSSATKKMCGVVLNLYKASKHHGIFLIDELDNSLNKNIARFILELYQKNAVKGTSQIIFTTNNADMLENFRRDQIYLIEKKGGINVVTKYLNFTDKNNKKSRKDWSFVKAYNDNIINNYPSRDKITGVCDSISNYLNGKND